MQTKRPKLSDPEEYAIIKDIYFEKDFRRKEKLDPIEDLERMDSRLKNLKNQAR